MCAIDVPCSCAPGIPEGPLRALSDVSCKLFDALSDLHGFSESDCRLMSRAVCGLRLMRSGDRISAGELLVFHLTLADLEPHDAWVVETAACYATERAADREIEGEGRATLNDHTRALWFGALLRLSGGLGCLSPGDAPTAVFAVWTDDLIFIEFDGGALMDYQIRSARSRVTALELLVGRRALLARSSARRVIA